MNNRKAVITQEHIQNLNQYGYRVVDSASLGGGTYNLVLTYSELMESYHLAMQRDGYDFADITQTMDKFPEPIGAQMSEAIPILNKWIQEYKTLWVSGDNPRKVRVYGKILRRLGYKYESFSLMGVTLLSISEPAPLRISSGVHFKVHQL
jgi:hypothetical protein